MQMIEKNNDDFRFGLSTFNMAMNKYGDLVSITREHFRNCCIIFVKGGFILTSSGVDVTVKYFMVDFVLFKIMFYLIFLILRPRWSTNICWVPQLMGR